MMKDQEEKKRPSQKVSHGIGVSEYGKSNQRLMSEAEDSLQRGSSIDNGYVAQDMSSRSKVLKDNSSQSNSKHSLTQKHGQKQPVSISSHHHSKATSLVRRKTSDLDEEEELQYSESNIAAGSHFFQLESQNIGIAQKPFQVVQNQSIIKKNTVPLRDSVMREESQAYTDQNVIINPNFLKDVNLECTRLISQLQESNAEGTPQIAGQVDIDENYRNSKTSLNQLGSIDQTELAFRGLKKASPQNLMNTKSASGPIESSVRKRGDHKTHAENERRSQNFQAFQDESAPAGIRQSQNTNPNLFKQRLNEDSERSGATGVLRVSRDRTSTTYDIGGHQIVNDIRSDSEGSGFVNIKGLQSTSVVAQVETNIKKEQKDIIISQTDSQNESVTKLHDNMPQKLIKLQNQSNDRLHQIRASATNSFQNQSNKITFRQQPPGNPDPFARDDDDEAKQMLSEFVRDDISDDDDEGFSRAQTTEQQAMWKDIEKFKLAAALSQQDAASSNDRSQYQAHMLLERNDSKFTTNGLPPLNNERRVTTNDSKIDIPSKLHENSKDQSVPKVLHQEGESDYEAENDFEAMDDEPETIEEPQKPSKKIDNNMRDSLKNDSIVQVMKEDEHSSEKRHQHQLTDDVVYNRLPKNFFVQDVQEQLDLGEVMESIKKMRNDFQGYMNESKVQQKLDEISDMIFQPPEKFVERHLKAMGLEGGEELLFEKIIAQSPSPSTINNESHYMNATHNRNNKSSLGSGIPDGHSITIREAQPSTNPNLVLYQMNDQPDMFTANLSDDNYQTRGSGQSKVQFCEPIYNNPSRMLQDAVSAKGNVAEIEERINRKDYEQFPPREDLGSPKSSSSHNRQLKHLQQPPVRSIRDLKMADYFKDQYVAPQSVTSQRNQDYLGLPNDNSAIQEECNDDTRASSPHLNGNSSTEEELPDDIKERLVDRLEQDILGNLDVNFLFNKGDKLRHGLIDQGRLYKIMMKIKEIAHKQIQERGSKQIDYTAIVRYLEEEDQFINDGQQSELLRKQNEKLQTQPTMEPKKSKIPKEEPLDDNQWIQVVDFMRKNPKLMLQMLPDSLEQQTENNGAETQSNLFMQNAVAQGMTTIGQVNAAKAQEDAKQMQKLKALSSKYVNNRKDFLEAIDRLQENQLIALALGSPKNVPGNQRAIQVKSISQNQKKIKRAHAIQQNKDFQDNILISSDGEGVRTTSQETRNTVQKPLIFQKQFLYSSSNQASRVYNAPAFPVPIEEQRVSSAENDQSIANPAAQQKSQPDSTKYQQHSMLNQLATKTTGINHLYPGKKRNAGNDIQGQHLPVKSLSKNQNGRSFIANAKGTQNSKQGGPISDLDSTTLACTGTVGQFTNMKQYRNQINHIHTISQEDQSDRPGVTSTTSMFTKFMNPVGEQQNSSQRRPITANAAMGGGQRHNTLAKINAMNQPPSSYLSGQNQKSVGNFIRQPSASGMSSFTNDMKNQMATETPVNQTSQFPKFLNEKKIAWLNSAQHIKEVAKQTDQLNQSLKSQENTEKEDITVLPKVNKSKRDKRFKDDKNTLKSDGLVSIGESRVGNTSPQPKTQEFINKIAPSIRPTEHVYPKFVSKIRGQKYRQDNASSVHSNGDQAIGERIANNQSANSSANQSFIVNLKQRKSEAHAGKGALKKSNTNKFASVNQSVGFIAPMSGDEQSMASSRLNQTVMEHTPQGEYPKFIKGYNRKRYTNTSFAQNSQLRQGSAHSHNRRSAERMGSEERRYNSGSGSVGAEARDPGYSSKSSVMLNGERRGMINEEMQTNIGGTSNKIIVSPAVGGPYGGTVEGCRFDQEDEFEENEENGSLKRKQYIQRHKLLIPIVDWAYTPLFEKSLTLEALTFNEQKDMSMYEEKEVDYVIDMMKNKYKDFKRSDIMRPFYLKAQMTLKTLFEEQTHEKHFDKIMHKYREITIENTMKLLIRCKLAFHSRQLIFDILKQIVLYEAHSQAFKELVETYPQHKVDQPDYDKLQDSSSLATESGHHLLLKIKSLRDIHKQYRSMPFIFKRKDYVNFVKSEMGEARRVMFAFRVRTEEDILQEKREKEEAEIKRLEFEFKIQQQKEYLMQKGVPFNEEEYRQQEKDKEEYEPESEEDQEEIRRRTLSPLRVVP